MSMKDLGALDGKKGLEGAMLAFPFLTGNQGSVGLMWPKCCFSQLSPFQLVSFLGFSPNFPVWKQIHV